ncbi:hypothetical protein FB45DRAFT_396973 [Roridomyces roridus]|uniref:Uncharacterized protein n=1 Tax=Roridomyces roridus TaxID=1738132 RepID=A0AAD7C3F2_9AGAR|nr:hypothetical protein FB45DRAFT_396973 [Roridomyces roridus]
MPGQHEDHWRRCNARPTTLVVVYHTLLHLLSFPLSLPLSLSSIASLRRGLSQSAPSTYYRQQLAEFSKRAATTSVGMGGQGTVAMEVDSMASTPFHRPRGLDFPATIYAFLFSTNQKENASRHVDSDLVPDGWKLNWCSIKDRNTHIAR